MPICNTQIYFMSCSCCAYKRKSTSPVTYVCHVLKGKITFFYILRVYFYMSQEEFKVSMTNFSIIFCDLSYNCLNTEVLVFSIQYFVLYILL